MTRSLLGWPCRVVVAVVVVLIATAVPAEAWAPRPVLLDTVDGPVRELATDGTRFVAFKPVPQRIRVFDLLRARSWEVAVDPACSPRDGYGGLLLVACEPAAGQLERPGPFLLDLRSRGYRPVPVDEQAARLDTFFLMGRHWIEGFEDYARVGGRTYLNWRTGEYRKGDGDVATRNIDSAQLRRIRSRGWFGQSGPFYLTFRDVRLGGPFPLELRRKGRGRSRVISRCSGNPACRHMQLSWSVATWTERRNVYAYDFRARRKHRWPASASTDAVHTKDHVVFADTQQVPAGTPTRIWAARIPRR